MTKDEAQHVRLLAAQLTTAFFAGAGRNPDLTTGDVIAKYYEVSDEILKNRAEVLEKTVRVPIP